jgi:RNA polymerase sigma-70 factor, ECF subfamily
MRRILVDDARRRNHKRGAVELEETAAIAPGRAGDMVALDEALQALAHIDPRKARVVELRFFGGWSVDETVEVPKVSANTVMRDWSTARAWLHREMSRGSSDGR